MATVKQILSPEEAQFLTANFPQFVNNAGSNFPVSGLAYDASVDENAYWKVRSLNYASGNLTLKLLWYADTATSGNVVWQAQLAAIAPDVDAVDVETKALATLNFVQDTHLGTVGQRVHTCTITITNLDSIAADDAVWLKISRDADGTNATDDMTGDVIFILAELTYVDVSNTVTGPATSTDKGVARYSGTGGAVIQDGAGVTITDGGTLQAPTLTAAGAAITNNMVQNSQSTNYTTVLSDAGKHIYHPSSDTTARTFTIDSNANVAYPVGTSITFINDSSAGVVTIAITSDTLVLMGAGSTGSRTLAANGIATAIKVGTTRWVISGNGLT